MTSDLQSQLERYTSAVVSEQRPTTASEIQTLVGSVRPVPEPRNLDAVPPRRRLLLVASSAAAVLVLIGGVAALSRFSEPPSTDEAAPATLDRDSFEGNSDLLGADMSGGELVFDGSGSAATGGSPLPDVGGVVAGDDGSGPLPLGTVSGIPDSVQLDFLFEFCWGPNGGCFRDGHFMDPSNPGVGSGPFTSGEPFHVRHGFINNGDEPLGDGFDVVIYVLPMDEPGEFGGESIGDAFRYTSDYVVRGTSEQCGPTYRSQEGPVTCEWFVHEFNDGLPEGRHALWAVWEAPCSAWVDYGFTDSCADPNEVMSLFSSGFDSPFGPFPPSYDGESEGP
jgi:hypothetical protein